MSLRRLAFLSALCLSAWPAAGQQHAALRLPQTPLVAATELFHAHEFTGLVLRGFDPISYFLEEGPRPGRRDLELIWGGVAWRFASEANRAAFQADPTAYAPQFGGYDAEAMSRGRIVDADPAIYLVRDGRLYLFRNDATRARFLADPAIAKESGEQWARLKDSLVQQ